MNLNAQRVLIREDLNVPMKNGKITSDERIIAALPTIKNALLQNAAVILMSHLGRPTEGKFEEEYSLKPVAERLSQLLNQEVTLIKDWQNGVEVKPGQVVLLENVRFNMGEGKNSPELAKKYAQLCDIFVMDAFATAHRAQASTAGVAKFAKQAIAGFKLRQGDIVGLQATLRGKRMWEFLNRLIAVAIPRWRDFRGLPRRGFDQQGSYSFGIREQTIFPEIHEENLAIIHGLGIVLTTTATNRADGEALLEVLGLPLEQVEAKE